VCGKFFGKEEVKMTGKVPDGGARKSVVPVPSLDEVKTQGEKVLQSLNEAQKGWSQTKEELERLSKDAVEVVDASKKQIGEIKKGVNEMTRLFWGVMAGLVGCLAGFAIGYVYVKASRVGGRHGN
jgi:hypothetical protein